MIRTIFGRQLKINRTVRILNIIIIPFIFVFACEKDFPTDSISLSQNIDHSNSLMQSTDYPQSVSVNLNYNFNTKNFADGQLEFFDGSYLHIPASSLTLHFEKSYDFHINVTGSIENDLNKKEIIFTFGPSGSQFNPPASLWINYKNLTINGTPKFYFIDSSGKYIQQQIEEINTKSKMIKAIIHHFSRYALAYGG